MSTLETPEPSALPSAPTTPPAPPSPTREPSSPPSRNNRRRGLLLAGSALALLAAAYLLAPVVSTALNTISTDDAYINGHVTFVAPRITGQVARVLVDDNQRVRKGDLLVQLDREPWRVQVSMKEAAVAAAQADLLAANALVHGQIAQARASRFKLQHTIQEINTQSANLAAAVATLNSARATLALAESNLKRALDLAPGAISREEIDQRRQQVTVQRAAVDQALQQVYALRVGLGLPAQPAPDVDLAAVPPRLDQDAAAVRQDLALLVQSAAQFGYFPSTWESTPDQTIESFYGQDPDHNLDRILDRFSTSAPSIQQAQARLLQAQRDLEQARLNLKYCDIVSEIDGVVTSRNVNPGNNVLPGQSLLAVRSITEIWIDANFKETQLADLRIGQPVRCEVDMYGGHREFSARISGFTMGTGQTLALLPPQNATGNFVKIVQRLPVRIELTDYDPDKLPLFVGLSVTPYVYYKQPPQGPHAGQVLQPLNPKDAQ